MLITLSVPTPSRGQLASCYRSSLVIMRERQSFRRYTCQFRTAQTKIQLALGSGMSTFVWLITRTTLEVTIGDSSIEVSLFCYYKLKIIYSFQFSCGFITPTNVCENVPRERLLIKTNICLSDKLLQKVTNRPSKG